MSTEISAAHEHIELSHNLDIRFDLFHAIRGKDVQTAALPDKNIFAILIVVLLTGGIGYVLGWLSLKKVQGSILYGWVIHATVNILSPIIVFTFLLPNYTVQ